MTPILQMLLVVALTIIFAVSVDATEPHDIRMPPSININPDTVIVYMSGELVVLTCEAEGTPQPAIRWNHNNAPLDENRANIIRPDESKGTIVIEQATALDQGLYQCIAENQYGKAVSDITTLRRATMGSIPPKEEQIYTKDQGSALKIPCEAIKCFPPCVYDWALVQDRFDQNPTRVVRDDRVHIDFDGNLYFANLEQSDQQGGKVYKCIVFNPYLDISTEGSYSVVNVNPAEAIPVAPVVAYQTPASTVGLVGEAITLKCVFSGNPTPKISWKRRNGQALPVDRIEFSNSNSELEFFYLTSDDEGEYVCTALNTAGSSEVIISLDIQAKPAFADFNGAPGYLTNVNVTEEDTVRLHCNADGEPSVALQWFINGEPFHDSAPAMRLENEDRTLVISDVCKTCPRSDLMVVQCNASNSHGYVYSSAYVNVLLATRMVAPPETVALRYPYDTVFTCQAVSDPSTPVSYFWMHNGSAIQYETGRREQNEDGSLRIITEHELDRGEQFGGNYTCTASNGYSYATASAQLEGRIPRIDIHPKNATINSYGGSVEFECEASGSPNPVFHWYHNNVLLNESLPNIFRPVDTQGTLRIDPTTALDLGFFQCFAVNQYGNVASNVAILEKRDVNAAAKPIFHAFMLIPLLSLVCVL